MQAIRASASRHAAFHPYSELPVPSKNIMIYTSPHAPITIPSISLPHFILDCCDQHGTRTAILDSTDGTTISYAELARRIRGVARGLAAAGLKKGEVVAIISPNDVRFPVAFHGVALAGGVNTTINPVVTEEDFVRQFQDSRTVRIICAPSVADKVRAAALRCGIRDIHLFGEDSFDLLMDSMAPMPVVSFDVKSDLVALPYSSGTSGLPKGVMLTHFNLVANILQSAQADDSGEHDRVLAVLPFFHIYGMSIIMNMMLLRGAAVVVMKKFEPELFLNVLQEQRITKAYLAPPLVLFLAKSPLVARYDLSALHTIASGAAPLDQAVSDACGARLHCLMRQGYGMSETSPTIMRDGITSATVRAGTVGCPSPNTEVRLIDPETGTDAPQGGPGEIWVRGPQVMAGYLAKPEETAKVMSTDGWFKTGDIATVDADGFFRIVDRLKELIKYKGFQVPPSELEGYVLEHPAVLDAAVIPVADAEAGEIPKAFVVLKPGHQVSANSIMDFVAAKVAPYKKIRQMEFIDSIPKSPTGKILRRILVERERSKAA